MSFIIYKRLFVIQEKSLAFAFEEISLTFKFKFVYHESSIAILGRLVIIRGRSFIIYGKSTAIYGPPFILLICY